MEKAKLLRKVKKIYDNGGNILEYFRNLENKKDNSEEEVMISYDFQAGSYLKFYEENKELKDESCYYIAQTIKKLGIYRSILEVGVGEGTTLAPVISNLKIKDLDYYGFDISWSRVKYARKFLEDRGLESKNIFQGNLFNIPLKDNSIDIVYTVHSIEPNGGREKEALEELYRVANKYLVLIEPAYEFADEEAKARMLRHGYITKLFKTAQNLRYEIIEHRPFNISLNKSNPTGLIVIKKNNPKLNDRDVNDCPLCCPVTKTDLKLEEGSYYSEESFLAYPIIQGIPCLNSENAILATKF